MFTKRKIKLFLLKSRMSLTSENVTCRKELFILSS